jgi:hypothetical protein
MTQLPSFGSIFVGGGPAGLAPIVHAIRCQRLSELVQCGLLIVEQREQVGAGALGAYAIDSDTLAEAFTECIDGSAGDPFAGLRRDPVTLQVLSYRGGSVPLALAARFLEKLGTRLQVLVEESGGMVLTNSRAVRAQQTPDGGWVLTVQRHGQMLSYVAKHLVLATGAEQSTDRLATARVAGRSLLSAYPDKVIQSGALLGLDRAAVIHTRLGGRSAPHVAIVGGSHSAVASAYVLLNHFGLAFPPRGVALLHRRPLRVFYLDATVADADGYTEYGPDDICPRTGRVFRLAGFRLHARDLVMHALGIGGRVPDPRLQLHLVSDEDDPAGAALLNGADLIVAALGYRPRALTLQDQQGRPILLRCHGLRQGPMVDGRCHVIDGNGQIVPGLLGIGVAAGFVPSGPLGGEPSFRGQTNGLWLWQHDIGALIIDALLEGACRVAA